jgi:hypothetical protein
MQIHPRFVLVVSATWISLTLGLAPGCSGENGAGGGAGTKGSGGRTTLSSGGQEASGGSAATGSGGRSETGGAMVVGGSAARGGSSGVGGGAGGSAAGGSSGGGNGGRSNSGGSGGGSTGSGGTMASGGRSGGGNTGNGGTLANGACGPTTHNQYPLGCKFGWGIAGDNVSLASYSYLQFASYWIDSTISASGTYTNCNGCNWLKNSVASTNLIPAYYAYIIGFLAHANGIVDGNQSGGKKLTTDGAALVKANYTAIVNAYAWYAQKTAAAWPTKPLIWLLEGDFVQLVDSGQSSPMSYADVGKLAADITCAIKSNMPNAVVAIDHSSWNSDQVTNSYWGAMANVNYDMVWTTGVANNNGLIAGDATSSTYNAKTATYAYLHKLTGRTILVDTSAGASAAGDSWSTAGLANVNARIADGVIAANITGTAPGNLQSNISGLSGLTALPGCQ